MGFFGSLFGTDQQRDLANANAQATAALSGGRKRARREYTTGLTNALGRINPYEEGGREGFDLYRGSIGAGGPEGYRRAYETFQADPFLAGSEAAAQGDLDRLFARYNNRGYADAGTSRRAIADASMGAYDRRVADMRNRWQGLGERGQGVAQFGAGLESDMGNRLGDLEYGYGQQRAANDISYGNALAASRSIPINNLLNIAGLGVRGYSAYKGIPARA